MDDAVDAWLNDVLRNAPCRFLMPALPADAGAAQALGPTAAVTWAMEHARLALAGGSAVNAAWGDVFVRALAVLVDAALQPERGDAAFQARVLQARSPVVGEHLQLAASHVADRRRVRTGVNALAHPAKLQDMPASRNEVLQQLHSALEHDDWAALNAAMDDATVPMSLREDSSFRAALARLLRAARLNDDEDVRRFDTLRHRQAPAGAATSTARGEAAERSAAQAFAALAARANEFVAGAAPRVRIVSRLLLPAGFPGNPARSKNEWDIALVREDDHGDGDTAAAELLLLAEVKASPDAAVSDLPNLLRGLRRFGAADGGTVYTLPCDSGTVRLHGRSLQRFQPMDHTLPPRVVYVSGAAPERSPPWLDAAARGALLAQPQVLTFALQRDHAGASDFGPLRALWTAITQRGQAAHLLHHHDAARHVRAALLHPDDLLAAAMRT